MEERENWYAIYTVGNQEEKVKKILENLLGDKIRVIIPKRQLRERKDGLWHMVEKKLFPNYVLVKGDIDTKTYYEIKNMPVSGNLLRDQQGLLKIDDRELRALKILIDEKEEVIGISKAYRENERVKIIDGPLLGLEAQILSIDRRKGRAKVSIDFLGESKSVQLGIDFIDKL